MRDERRIFAGELADDGADTTGREVSLLELLSVVARDSVAALRTEAGRNPYDRGLTDLVGELSTRSEQFRTWWAAHNVKFHTTSTKTMCHPAAGELELTGEALTLPGDHGLTIITYTVEPHSASEQALNFLASWSAQASPANPHESETLEETR